MSPRLVLIGTMGAGKTSVGREVAARLGLPFRDTDADVEATAGQPISEIFVDHGEAHFRALEREAVANALAEHDGILALGGGAVLAPETQALLAGQQVVFLRVGLSDSAKRIGLGVSRPMLMGNMRARVKQLIEERAPIYQSLATHVIETDDRSLDQVVESVLEVLS